MARPLHELQVVRTEQVTPHITRVVLGGNGFDGFEANADTDSYAKLIFLPEGHEGPGPRDIDQARDMQATVRTYTIRSVDADRREIAIDFVVHGDTGVAGPWAARATPGDKLYLTDSHGAYSPDPAADWHLLAGDESAVPAITVALQALPEGARAKVFIEVAGPQDEIAFDTRGDVEIVWVHRGAGADEVDESLAGDNARWWRRFARRSGCPDRCRYSSTARPRPSCTTCGRTYARNVGSHRSGPPRFRAIGAVGEPRRLSACGSRS